MKMDKRMGLLWRVFKVGNKIEEEKSKEEEDQDKASSVVGRGQDSKKEKIVNGVKLVKLNENGREANGDSTSDGSKGEKNLNKLKSE